MTNKKRKSRKAKSVKTKIVDTSKSKDVIKAEPSKLDKYIEPFSKAELERLAETMEDDLITAFPDYSTYWLRYARKRARELFPDWKRDVRQELIDKYVALVKELGRVPRAKELDKIISRGEQNYYFPVFDDLDKVARKQYPGSFPDVRLDEVRAKEIPEASTYVITTAVLGAPVHQSFLDSLRYYCKQRNAQLLIVTCEDPAHNRITKKRKYYESIAAELKDEVVIGNDTQLNSNLIIRNIKTSAKQVEPTTGLMRLAKRSGTSITASPKQRMRVVPSIHKWPSVVMTTGAVTVPDYTTQLYWSLRTAYLAAFDHVCGAIVVDIVDDKRFHFRQIQSDEDGSIIDASIRYCPIPKNANKLDKKEKRTRRPKPKREDAVSITFGDLHVGYEEEDHRNARYEMLRYFRPKYIVVHDIFDGGTITHHDMGKYITRAMRPHIDLRKEISGVRLELVELAKYGQVIVVPSNHDEALSRYLDEMRWQKDPVNFDYALELSKAQLEGHRPLAYACQGIPNVKFLEPDEPFILEGIEHGQHGHRGPNGSRGSMANLEKSFGPSNIAHSHQPEILRMCWRAGCSCMLRMDYNKGPSGWMNSHIVTYKGGLRQLINVFDGDWGIVTEETT